MSMSSECVEQKQYLLDWIATNKMQVSFAYPLPEMSLIAEYLYFPGVDIAISSNYAGKVTEPACQPALKNLDLDVLNVLQQACKQESKPEWLFLWAEKLLRVCEVRKLDLQERIEVNVDGKKAARIKTLRLCLFFLNCFYIYNDARYVNIVLKIIDLKWLKFKDAEDAVKQKCDEKNFLQILVSIFVEVAIGIIKSADWSPEIIGPYKNRLLDEIDMPIRKVVDESPGVVIFSPNPFGITTLCAAELLKIHGIDVRAIVVRRLFNFKRLLQELRRDGLKWVYRKITHKLLFRKLSCQNYSFKTIIDFASEIGVEGGNVKQWCRTNGTELVFCDTLNDKYVHDCLIRIKPKLVVFVGGGIVNEKTLELAGDGVLNCHGGLLPWYRGLDLNEWPLLEKHPEVIGCATHFMSKYVDEGGIFYMHRLDVKGLDTIDKIIKYGEVFPIKLLVYTVINYFKDKVTPLTQNKEDGRQFFYMHPRLVAIAKFNLQKYAQEQVLR
jgi:methionyl-tRNA formyltransferase